MPDPEIGDGVPHGVVDSVRPRDAERLALLDDVEAGGAKQRGQLGGPVVDDDDEPLGVARRSSLRLPARTTVPSPRITTSSQIRSASSRWCDEITMSMPNSVPTRRISASMSSRWSGSSPSVGSSSRTSAGSWTIAPASLTRCRCPVDIVPIGRNRSSPRPTCQSASFARWIAARGGQPVELAEVPDEIGGVDVGRQVVVLGREADAGAHVDPGRRRVVPEHRQLAGIARAETEDERDERRLPRLRSGRADR